MEKRHVLGLVFILGNLTFEFPATDATLMEKYIAEPQKAWSSFPFAALWVKETDS